MESNNTKSFDLYDSQERYADSSKERSIKPIIAGLLLLIPGGGIFFFGGILRLIDDYNNGYYLASEPFIISLRVIMLVALFISMIGGYFAIRRTHYKFALYSSVLCFVGLNPAGIISLYLLLSSEYEFES